MTDPGSFRDPASRVVMDGDRVVRVLDARGVEAWKSLASSRFFKTAVEDGRLIEAEEVPQAPEGGVGAVEHPRLPLITYPYEWTFSMLKDAALLQLDLLEEALAEDLTIKDATPFNIQFLRGRPLFIDIGSFEPYRDGDPWIGYRQFTRQFLFPLMLRSWLDVPFQPWLRGDMEGPTAAHMSKLIPLRKRLTPGALTNVTLQARMEARMSGQAVREDLKRAGFGKELILANLRRLRKLVSSLRWDGSAQGWADYRSCAHVERDREDKSEFLAGVLTRLSPSQVLDLGANDGHFSAIAADSGSHAVALDNDEPILDDLYRRSRDRGIAVILSDMADPSPSQGWAGTERSGLRTRVRPDLVVAYGVIHHLVYTSSIPPRNVIGWLRGFDCPVVLELVTPDDEMVALLTVNKRPDELHPGRTEPEFRTLLGDLFEIRSSQTLQSRTRILLELTPR